MPDYSSSSFRGNCLSLNRIYGDPHVLTANNRIKFLENRRRKLPLSIEQREGDSEVSPKIEKLSGRNPHSGYILKTIATEENECDKDLRVTTHREKMVELREVKSRRYKQSKENSERIMKTITSQKSNDILLKRLRRMQILREQERSRDKLSAYEETKIKHVQQSCKIYVQDSIAMKGIELKRQLMQQQGKSLEHYEQALSYKSELMRKIRTLIELNA